MEHLRMACCASRFGSVFPSVSPSRALSTSYARNHAGHAKTFAPTTGANWVSGSERAQCGCCTSETCTSLHRRRSAHCMRTVPRGRVWWEAGSLTPITTVSSTTRYVPYLHYANYLPLPATSTPALALVIGPPPGLPARPGKRPDRCDSQAS
jgi:hypothetical protein